MTNNIDLEHDTGAARHEHEIKNLCHLLDCAEEDLAERVRILIASNRALIMARDENSDLILKLRDEKFALEKVLRELTP